MKNYRFVVYDDIIVLTRDDTNEILQLKKKMEMNLKLKIWEFKILPWDGNCHI